MLQSQAEVLADHIGSFLFAFPDMKSIKSDWKLQVKSKQLQSFLEILISSTFSMKEKRELLRTFKARSITINTSKHLSKILTAFYELHLERMSSPFRQPPGKVSFSFTPNVNRQRSRSPLVIKDYGAPSDEMSPVKSFTSSLDRQQAQEPHRGEQLY